MATRCERMGRKLFLFFFFFQVWSFFFFSGFFLASDVKPQPFCALITSWRTKKKKGNVSFRKFYFVFISHVQVAVLEKTHEGISLFLPPPPLLGPPSSKSFFKDNSLRALWSWIKPVCGNESDEHVFLFFFLLVFLIELTKVSPKIVHWWAILAPFPLFRCYLVFFVRFPHLMTSLFCDISSMWSPLFCFQKMNVSCLFHSETHNLHWNS